LIEAIEDSQKEWIAVRVIGSIWVLVRDKVLGRVEDRGLEWSNTGEFLLNGLQQEFLIIILQAGSDPDRCSKSLLDSFDRANEGLWGEQVQGETGFKDSLTLAGEGSHMQVGGSLSDSKVEFHDSFSLIVILSCYMVIVLLLLKCSRDFGSGLTDVVSIDDLAFPGSTGHEAVMGDKGNFSGDAL
jgi:hypothetical protein